MRIIMFLLFSGIFLGQGFGQARMVKDDCLGMLRYKLNRTQQGSVTLDDYRYYVVSPTRRWVLELKRNYHINNAYLMDSLTISIFRYCDSANKVILHTFYAKQPEINMDFYQGQSGCEWECWALLENELYIGVTGTTDNTSSGYDFFKIDVSSITWHPDEAVSTTGGSTALPKAIQATNTPNPFNPLTTIEYQIPTDNYVAINIYNIRGELVRVLGQNFQKAGTYRVVWDGRSSYGSLLPSGEYLYQIVSGPLITSKKLVILK